MIEIFDPRSHSLTDDDILSFHKMIHAPDQTEWDYEEVIQFFRGNFLPRQNNHAFWAKADGQIVGMVGINRFEASARAHCAELGFGVAEKYQRQGVGYQLVGKVIDTARAIGLKRLEAECFADNMRAIALLRKAGFNEEGVRVGAIQKRGVLRDIRLFGLLLQRPANSRKETSGNFSSTHTVTA